jgi:hypothetical protein
VLKEELKLKETSYMALCWLLVMTHKARGVPKRMMFFGIDFDELQ